MSEIRVRLDQLRAAMTSAGVTHYLVPSADEHLNEYLPARNLRREWCSGFSGSAGELLIAVDPEETKLFVDGRYHIQAEQQLAGTSIRLERLGTKSATPIDRTLAEFSKRHGSDFRLGVDPLTLSAAYYRMLERSIKEGRGQLVLVDSNLVDTCWTDRPALDRSPLEYLPDSFTGESAAAKVARIREALAKAGATATLTVKLDQIAWLSNLRSLRDVPYNPVFLGWLYLDMDRVHLFVNSPRERIRDDVRATLSGWEFHDYSEFLPFLRSKPKARTLIDLDRTTYGIASLDNFERIEGLSPIEQLKARKNASELSAMRDANRAASAVKTKALLWLREVTDRGEPVTERRFQERIEQLYAALPAYRQLSFHTISAAGEHAAMPHYGSADDTPLNAGEYFIIDSGIQYGGGTTDDTRTLGVGHPSAEKRRLFTLVLKAHIQGASTSFPEGTTGAAIDAIVRQPLWAHGLNYDHGTGHGVGSLLNVHEGPFTIGDHARRPASGLPLEPGFITSIEPGYYAKEVGGIRHENLYVVSERNTGPDGRRWFAFETLTYIPFDVRWIDFSLLDARERDWLDRYHDACREQLAPMLTDDEREALDRYFSEASTAR